MPACVGCPALARTYSGKLPLAESQRQRRLCTPFSWTGRASALGPARVVRCLECASSRTAADMAGACQTTSVHGQSTNGNQKSSLRHPDDAGHENRAMARAASRQVHLRGVLVMI